MALLLARHSPAEQDALSQLSRDKIGNFTVPAGVPRAEDDSHNVRGTQDLQENKRHIKTQRRLTG